jgi:acetyltransferase-like isoleucine patch superfamily enzyme
MALQIDDHGAGNIIEVAPADFEALSGRVAFTGNGAHVAIGTGCIAAGLHVQAGDDARIHIGADCHLGALFIHASAGTRVAIGAGCGINGLVRLLLHEPGRISIGAGCLIAAEVDITVSDMHPIFDAATGARINPAADVEIGDRVWIGQRGMVLKGARIGHDSVIGAGAVVTGMIPAQCIAAGNPARVVRTGVRWAMNL